MNRFQSIVDGVASGPLGELRQQAAQIPAARWYAKGGKLIAIVEGEHLELSFEEGEPITDSLLLFLNNHKYILGSSEVNQ